MTTAFLLLLQLLVFLYTKCLVLFSHYYITKPGKRDHFEWQNETFSNFFWTVNGMKYHKYSKYLLSIWIQYINFLYHFWTKVENICTLKRASATYKSYLFTDNVWLIHCTGVRQSGNQMFSTWVVYTKDFSIEGFFFSGLLGLL